MGKYFSYAKNILLPCVIFSALTGALTGVGIFFFKIAAAWVIEKSDALYAFVRVHPAFLPVLLAACVAVGLLASLLLHISRDSRGGGIPTSVALLRGQIAFHWIKNLLTLPFSAMLSYFAGLPLGNEGPSVQMGTAIGKGSSALLSKKDRAWSRYLMTGGACAGFATATGAPISGIFFALEEAHRRFTPMLIMVASTAVLSGGLVMNALCDAFGVSPALFHFDIFPPLPVSSMWTAVAVGLVCGLCAALFTRLYKAVHRLGANKLRKMPFYAKMACLFLATGLLGFLSPDFLGSGHGIIDRLVLQKEVWYSLLVILAVRVLLLVFANNIGATGGLFIPTLAFGALIGSLLGGGLTYLGWLPEEHYATVVILSVVAFLSAFVRTPITAVLFAVEALGAYHNILPVILAACAAYVTIELTAVECFYETVIHARVAKENAGKTSGVIDDRFVVQAGSFIVGKELRDILWPPSCIVLSVYRAESGKTHSDGPIKAGDSLHIHAATYDRDKTLQDLDEILGTAG